MVKRNISNSNSKPVALFDSLEELKKAKFSMPEVDYGDPDDYKMAVNFLYAYRGSKDTFNTYRREVERYLQWCWLIAKKNILEIKWVDFEKYIEFCMRPPASWINLKHQRRYIIEQGERVFNPKWRPFLALISKAEHKAGKIPDKKEFKLSQKAIQSIFAVMGSFYGFLIQEQYTEANPVTQIRQKSKFVRKKQQQTIVRRLSTKQWQYVINTAQEMAEEDPVKYERTLFIMNALYGMYLRISELTRTTLWEPQMGDFYRDQDENWWFKTVGKGNKERIIAVSDIMLRALKRYRKHLGLSRLPPPGDKMPLLPRSRGGEGISSTRRIRLIVQECFDQAIDLLNTDGYKEEAEQIKSATVHWLRHTGISDDVKIRPREHVRDDAGHSSGAITDKYIDIELKARHASGKKKKIIPMEAV